MFEKIDTNYEANPKFIENLEIRIDEYRRTFKWLDEQLEKRLISESLYKEMEKETKVELKLLEHVLMHYKYLHQG